MRILKKLLLFIAGLIALLLIVAIFVPKNFQSERSIVVNKPKHEVFDYIRQVKNQDHFGVWQLSDPGMKRDFQGTDGTVGFKYTWDSEKLGKGSQTITKIVDGETVETELDFGFGEPAQAYFITKEADPNSTNITWGLKGRSPYPMNIMSLFFDVGEDIEQGLVNLKKELEK